MRRPSWDERNALIASLIPERSTVLDLGAGFQSLKPLLKSCMYQPCDVVRTTSDTWLLDFNRGLYPETSKRFDVVVLSGVIEYAKSPADLLARAASYGRIVLASYSPTGSETQAQREDHGWFNHLTSNDLEAIFDSIGLSYELVGSCLDRQLVYRLRAGR